MLRITLIADPSVANCVKYVFILFWCFFLQARRIAEEFLAPKVVDDDDEDDGHPADTSTTDHTSTSHATTSASAAAATEESNTAASGEAGTSTSAAGATGEGGEKKNEQRRAEEAEREAVAAAQNLSLLPDEPLDRLSNVIGTAMQHGKTVVFSVIRTAARQPNGDLIIPVVGGSIGVNGADKQDDGTLVECSANCSLTISEIKHRHQLD